MAQEVHASPGLSRKESIVDIVDDLSLLRVPKKELKELKTETSILKARKSRIQELKKENGTLNEGYERIVDDLEQTGKRWSILQQNYEKIKDVLQEKQEISFQEKDDFLAEAEERIKDLENRGKRFIVLIAGETSAGKSSLINLLLNDDKLLPTNILQSTLTICEISYGSEKEAVVHFGKPEMKPIKLEKSKFDEIKQYIEKGKDDEQWCNKIEIKIPNQLLQGGVVIVDSPGIGDSEDVNEISLEYLPQASAFIYVINSPNAGGLQEDRLMRIVEKWIKLYKTGKCSALTADSALFVCNKWDIVETHSSQSEKEKLEKEIVSKLKNKIPELDEQSQVIKMSVYTAAQVQKKFIVMSDDLSSLIEGMQRLLPLCIERKTDHFYWWISGQLTNLSDQVKEKMKNTKRGREERLKACEEVKVKLEKLKQGASIEETKEALENHMKRISEHIKTYLQSDDVKSAFCTWKEEDLPWIDDGQRKSALKVKEIYKTCIEQRLEAFLQELENKEKLFTTAHADLNMRFHRGFFEFEKDLRDIDRLLVGELMDDDTFNTFDVHPDKLRPPLDPRVKKYLALTSAIFMPVLFPIGFAAGLLSAPVFGYLAVNKHRKELQLKKDACSAVAKRSKKFLESFIKDDVVYNHVLQEFDDEKNRIISIKRCHKKLINKYEQRCSDLTKQEDDEMEKRTVEKLNPLNKTLQGINETLMFDAVQHGIQVMDPPCQIDKRRLQSTEKNLGVGTYGTVYKGKIRSPGHGKKKVAVKKLIKSPDPSNVASFLSEAARLKQLQHRYIVGFYGVAMDVQNHELISVALVFELCKRSLKNHISKHKTCIPWKTASAIAVTCQWSEQILDALEFIHSNKIVHRDLKLENILISRDEQIIKIADLGVATLENRITGTMCGTRLYMAPEVLERKVYDSKADMYSFGVIMWEMWFGKSPPDKLCSMSENEVTQQIHLEKLRGEGSFNPPPTEWMTLMMYCCHSNSSFRPTATEAKTVIIKKIKP